MFLSVLIIARDEEKMIGGALESVKGLGGEILVADNESRDRTAEIAKEYGARIFPTKEKDLGKMKQFLLYKAKSEWILILDADERVSPKLKNEINKAISKNAYDGYEIPYQNHFLGKPLKAGGENYSKLVLFRRKLGKINPAMLHEKVTVQGGIGKLKGKMLHYSYRSLGQLFIKFSEYALRAAKEKGTVTFAKLFFYGPHMFWSRFVKDQGYRDGWRGFILALAFAYLESLTYWWQSKLFVLPIFLTLHLFLLYLTKFVAWPEMLFYPWLSEQGLKLYRDYLIPYPPGLIFLFHQIYHVFGFSLATLRGISVSLILLTDLIIFFLVWQNGKRIILSAVVLTYFIFWQIIYSGNTLWFETLLLPLYLIVAGILTSGKLTRRSVFLAGLVTAAAIVVKHTAWMFFAISLVYLFFTKRKLIFSYLLPVIPIGLIAITGNNFPVDLLRYPVFPSLFDVWLIMPSIFPLLVGIWLFRKNRKIMYLAVLTMISYLVAFPRFSLHKAVPVVGLMALLLAELIPALSQLKINRKTGILFLVFFSLYLFGMLRSSYKFIIREAGQNVFWGQDYEYLGKLLAGKNYFVYGNYDYLYFYHQQKPTVLPWIQQFPWNLESAGIQEKIIAGLEAQKIPYVLSIPYPDYQPRKLGEYLESHYVKILELERNLGWLMQRK